MKIKSFSISGYEPEMLEGGNANTNLIICRFQDFDYSKCDVVITNPPFSVFREFMQLLIKAKVKFLIVGPVSAITYKDVIKEFVNGNVRVGYTSFQKFLNSAKEEIIAGRCFWYTNLKTDKRTFYPLSKDFVPDDYPQIEGTKIINVNKCKNIPRDYDHKMAVPVTFIQYLLPTQFKLFGLARDFCEKNSVKVRGKEIFQRLVIQKTAT